MKKNKALGEAIALAILGLGMLYWSTNFFGTKAEMDIKGLGNYILPLLFCVGYLKGTKRSVRVCREGFLPTLQGGIYLLFAAGFLGGLSLLTEEKTLTPGSKEILTFLALSLATGLFEEFLTRGLIQGILTEDAIDRGENPWKGIRTASFLFALLHLANLVDRPDLLLGTFSQVVYTFALGLLLGTLYYLYGNLPGVILLHGLFNFLGGISLLYIPSPQTEGDISLFSLLLQWVFILPAAILAKKIYRNRS